MEKIGFIGVGIMGKPMAKNLINVGYDIIAYDIIEKALNEIVEYGADRGTSPKNVAENSDVIFTMLPNSPQVKEVVLGEKGVIEGVRKGQILVDMSSIAPLASQEIARELEKKGVETGLARTESNLSGHVKGTGGERGRCFAERW